MPINIHAQSHFVKLAFLIAQDEFVCCYNLVVLDLLTVAIMIYIYIHVLVSQSHRAYRQVQQWPTVTMYKLL
jgi:hypothetical protein